MIVFEFEVILDDCWIFLVEEIMLDVILFNICFVLVGLGVCVDFWLVELGWVDVKVGDFVDERLVDEGYISWGRSRSINIIRLIVFFKIVLFIILFLLCLKKRW